MGCEGCVFGGMCGHLAPKEALEVALGENGVFYKCGIDNDEGARELTENIFGLFCELVGVDPEGEVVVSNYEESERSHEESV